MKSVQIKKDYNDVDFLNCCFHFSCLFCFLLHSQKCMRFNPNTAVWVAKQRILCTLNQSLKDVLNYGLFQPANGGRDGKFLDEERNLREYPQPISKGVPCLEVRIHVDIFFGYTNYVSKQKIHNMQILSDYI